MAEPGKVVKLEDGWFFVQGEVRIPADHESILKTVDALDKQNAGVWVALANANNIPADPFDRRILKPVLMGLIQEAWYRSIEGQVPEKCVVNQEARVKKYGEDLENLKKNPQAASASPGRRSSSSSEPKAPRSVKAYRLTEAKKDEWSKYKGQKKLIVDAMLAMGDTAASVNMIADAIKDKLETKQPPERVVAFYMNVFSHDGIVESPGEQSVLPETPAAKEPPPPGPAKQPAKKTGKKK